MQICGIFIMFLTSFSSTAGKESYVHVCAKTAACIKRRVTNSRASIRSSTIAILLKSVVSACQDPWPCPLKEHLFYSFTL